jgi:hypothetical protein
MTSQRNDLTYKEHLTVAATSGPYCTTMFLGDSLFQRIGRDTPQHVFNAGVGGDRIENLLYRLSMPDLWVSLTSIRHVYCGLVRII